ncbi:tyrosine-type recombinase/integrase [Streptomyces albidoflavus]|uniref:tyrosine-type recombinase/integrase n=1 Tax=Streptomyces TaxID=1883 RepID=UPI0020C6551D|nr:tyrosine-type recombinase/integrase [Streptomyces sp. BV333]
MFAEKCGFAASALPVREVMVTISRTDVRQIGVLGGARLSECKRDVRDRNYPCMRPRCGHAWTVRYRESGGRRGRQREKSFPRRIGLDGADAFAAGVEKDKNARVCIDPARGAMSLSVWAEEWLDRRVIGEPTRRNYEGFIRNHLVPSLGHKSLAGLARRDFEKFVKDIYRSGAGLAASTVNDRMVMVAAIMEAAVVDKRITENPARGVRISRRDALAVDEDEVPTSSEVDLIAAHITPKFRLTVYLQSGTGQRPSEALAFSTECRQPGFVRIRWQVSAEAHRENCQTPFVPLKHRLEKECRDIPTALFIEQEIDAHLLKWKPVPVVFAGQKGKRIRLETFFAPRQLGAGVMPSIASYGYQFKKACLSAGLVGPDGRPKYTPRSLRHFFASTALANGVPIHEVSRWLGHRSVKTTVDIYGHLLPSAWDRCRQVLQHAMRPAPMDAILQPSAETA